MVVGVVVFPLLLQVDLNRIKENLFDVFRTFKPESMKTILYIYATEYL